MAGYWCWIRDDLEPSIREPLKAFTFSFIWLAMVYNTIIAMYLRFFNKRPIHPYIDSYVKTKLILIPLLMGVCWILPTYDRYGPYGPSNENETLATLHLISSGLNGLFNSCVYAFSPGTMKLLWQKIKCKKKKEKGFAMFENQDGNNFSPIQVL